MVKNPSHVRQFARNEFLLTIKRCNQLSAFPLFLCALTQQFSAQRHSINTYTVLAAALVYGHGLNLFIFGVNLRKADTRNKYTHVPAVRRTTRNARMFCIILKLHAAASVWKIDRQG